MDALSAYKQAKRDLDEAKQFAGVVYRAGKVIDLVCYFNVFPKNSTIPSKMPGSIKDALQDVVTKKAQNLIEDCITALEAELIRLAEQVRVEYQQIAADAGIILGPAPNPVP